MKKMNKEKFIQTTFGSEMCNCIDYWDLCLSTKSYDRAKLCQKQWYVYQMALKQFYGVDYYFVRTSEYYGIVTEDYKDWLYKVEKNN